MMLVTSIPDTSGKDKGENDAAGEINDAAMFERMIGL